MINSPFLNPSADHSVGVIGAGHVSEVYHLPILDNMSNLSVSYIADIDPNRAKTLASHYGTNSFEINTVQSLPTCDVALLAIPVGNRSDYIYEFGDRGTPVFCEKPFATNLDTHQSYLDVSDRIMCNYMRTLFGSVQQIRQMLDSGIFGRIQRVEVFEESIGATNKGSGHYQTNPDKSGGMLLETGVHPLSQLLYLFDSGKWSVESADIVRRHGLDIDIRSQIRVHGEADDVEISFQLSRSRPIGNRARFVFETVDVECNLAEPSSPVKVTPSSETSPQLRLELGEDLPQTIHQAMFLRWAQFIRLTERRNRESIPLETGEDLTRLIDTLYAKGK